MTGGHVSLILMPTLKCNASCDYCFENKTSHVLKTERFAIVLEKMADYMRQNNINNMTIFWQGGEVFTLPPQYYQRANRIIEEVSKSTNIQIKNRIQSNMLNYSSKWAPLISEMFDNRIGSSLDFPNLHRRPMGGSTETYNETWFQRVSEARDSGIHVGVISIPNSKTLEVGARRFYSHFVYELGIQSFQLNSPFPGGRINSIKKKLPLNPEKLAGFFTDLIDCWIEDGYERGIRVGPFDSVLNYFLHDTNGLPCIWQANCTDEFICIDPRGYVSQCDCWAASYPEFWFGNILDSESVSEILSSEPRRRIMERPTKLIENDECIGCDYLSLCHGGCPIRAFTAKGALISTDPYCQTYKAVFAHIEQKAVSLVRERKVDRKTILNGSSPREK
jgi:uncharacterized protein